MAPAGAAALALAAAVCFLLVAPAPARRPADLPPQAVLPVVPEAVDREAAAEPLLLPKPAVDADADLTTAAALAVLEEEGRGPARARSSLLCLVFRCDDGDEANAVAIRKSGVSQDGGWWPRTAWKGDDSDSESDSDCESDSDDEEEGEGGIVGWFWSLAHRF
uniref:Uncharacterized protein n=1 Tax=Oryza punctata TaxID=4537 RepID=A0A0E0JFN8_ORYPU